MSRPVSGWIDPAAEQGPYESIALEDWIFNRLLRAADEACCEDESRRQAGESALRAAAAAIAKGEADHFYRLVDTRRPRKKKGDRAELVEAMREFRTRKPSASLQDFVDHFERLRILSKTIVEGRPVFVFDLDKGEYQVERLDKQWAEAKPKK